MKQQINLYQREFYEREIAFPAQQMFALLAGLILLSVLSSTGLALANMTTRHELEQTRLQAQTLKQQNEQLDNRLRNRTVNESLVAAATEASRQLQARQEILRLVEHTEKRDAIHFSELLTGLSRQHVQGMWLSYIHIAGNGHTLHLEGSTLNPRFVPEFIGKLSGEDAFAGREFRKIIMQRGKESSQVLDFVLTTQDPDSESLLMLGEKSGKGKAGGK